MKKINRLASLLLAIIMLFSVVGCGEANVSSVMDYDADLNDDFFTDEETITSDEEATSSGNSNSSATSDNSTPNNNKAPQENNINGKSWKEVLASMPKSLRGKTVIMYNWNPVSEYTGASEAIKKFEKDTGIKVKWQTVNWDVYNTRLAALVASDDAPDVVRCKTPRPDWMISLQPLSTAKFDFTDAAWDQATMKDHSVNGVSYVTSLKGTHIGGCSLIAYNKALIKKYDMEDPYILWKNGKWTLSKFIEMCREYKKEAKTDFAAVGAGPDGWCTMYGLTGPCKYDGNKYYNNLSDPKLVKAIQEYKTYLDIEKLFGEGRAEVFDSGESLFTFSQGIFLRKKNAYYGNIKSQGVLYAVPMPKIDGQSVYYQGRAEYEAYGIAKGSKNPEAVPYFLRYFLDPANYEMDGFLCNKQNLEVYNWCMNQPITSWSTFFWTGEDDFTSSTTGLNSVTPDQVKSFFDSNSGVIDKRVANYNKLLEDIKKSQ